MMLKNRKGQKELQMIISLIILLVVAVVVISLFLQVFGEKPTTGQDAIKRQKVITVCNRLCNSIKEADNQENKLSAIFNYCKRHFNYQPEEGQDKVVENVYIPSAGQNAFCKDQARCFNFDGGKCVLGGMNIDAQTCKSVLCKVLIDGGRTQEESKRLIEEEIMSPGNCELTMDAHPDQIYVRTWWEKYFKEVDCSMVSSSGSGDGEEGQDCNDVCGSGGATSSECVKEQDCGALMDLGHASSSEEGSCSSGRVCCCK